MRVIAHAGDASAVPIAHGQRFQDIVHLGVLEIKPCLLFLSERALALEVPDTVLVENNLSNRKLRYCSRGSRTPTNSKKKSGGHGPSPHERTRLHAGPQPDKLAACS